MSTKLNDLPPEDQEAIVKRRIEETRMLQRYASRSGDPIALQACWLDAEARRMGVHMEFSEDLDPEELT